MEKYLERDKKGRRIMRAVVTVTISYNWLVISDTGTVESRGEKVLLENFGGGGVQPVSKNP